jgi:hypothetical protein
MLLATPVVMSHILESKDKYDPYDINPAVIVVDEFDGRAHERRSVMHRLGQLAPSL